MKTIHRAVLTIGFVLFSGLAAAQSPPQGGAPATPSKEAVDEAKIRYERGTQLYTEGDYKLALIEFQRVYELVPNYKVLYNIGQINVQLGNYAAAQRAFEKYLAEGKDIPAKRKQEVEKEIANLRVRTAHVTVVANVDGAEVTVDGAAVGKTPLPEPLLVDAGEHTIALRKEGRIPANKTLTLASSDETKIEFDLPEQPPPMAAPVLPPSHERGAGGGTGAEQAGPSAGLWAGWILTVGLAGGAAVTGVLALGASNTLKDDIKKPTTRDDLDAQQNKTRSLALTTDILAGAAVVVGGITLYATLKSGGKPKHKTSSREIDLAVGPRGAAVNGSF